jgi:glycosyltransferase involved in cell wall biosynthesis
MLGWDTPALRELATSLGLDSRITWKGVVSYQQVAAEMQQADALLVFSRYESQGCVILEAHCCGLPVIATSVGGIPEIVSSKDTILVPSEDEDALLDAMQQMMDKRSSYDRAAIANDAQDKFSYRAVGKQFLELYNGLQPNS